MGEIYKPGDKIVARHRVGTTRATYTVQDPVRTSHGKLRLRRRLDGPIVTTWWGRDGSTWLPPRYEHIPAVENAAGVGATEVGPSEAHYAVSVDLRGPTPSVSVGLSKQGRPLVVDYPIPVNSAQALSLINAILSGTVEELVRGWEETP